MSISVYESMKTHVPRAAVIFQKLEISKGTASANNSALQAFHTFINPVHLQGSCLIFQWI